jgi:hypothetical protein
MKLGLFAAMMLLVSCAGPRPYQAGPSPGGTTNIPSETGFSQDAYECERQAAISASAGSRAQAFNECMKARGRTPQR